MTKDIKFIYFDVGGVAILDFSKTNKWQEMLEDLKVTQSDKKDFDQLFQKIVPDICTGKRNLDEFVSLAKDKLGLSFPDKYSMLDDFVNRFEANVMLHPIINKMSNRFKLGLLTNMYPGMFDRIVDRGILPPIDWDIIIDSSIVGFRKPQDEIYELAERKASVEPSAILFVENSVEHIKAAKARGWQTLLYDPFDLDGSNRALEMRLK